MFCINVKVIEVVHEMLRHLSSFFGYSRGYLSLYRYICVNVSNIGAVLITEEQNNPAAVTHVYVVHLRCFVCFSLVEFRRPSGC